MNGFGVVRYILMSNTISELISEKHSWHSIKKSDPYSYTIERDAQRLFYFGANHSHNPSNHQYPVLKYFWDRFTKLEKTKKLAMVEGGLRRVWEDEHEAVDCDGEAGWVTYHADKASVPVQCPEPTDSAERDFLLKRFSREEIQLYYFTRLVQPWHRKGQEWMFDDFYHTYYGDKYISFAKEKLSDWQDFDFSAGHMREVYQKTFDKAFDPSDQDEHKKLVSHARTGSVTNLVSAECSRFRDIAIVENILSEWGKGSSIFVCYGLSHAVFQEAALRELL